MEQLEKTVLAMVVQALKDYLSDAVIIFREETDLPQDIAEDITREALERMGLSGPGDRLYGKVDVKKAIYVFLPKVHPVALMLDAKAEKPNGDRAAVIQMSQTSMRVRMCRKGQAIDEAGKLEREIIRDGRSFYVATVIAKFIYQDLDEAPILYEEPNGVRRLLRVVVAAIPNGQLQERYNPTADDTIWRVGKDAPTLGEKFRVRLNYELLHAKAPWRVQEIPAPPGA